MPTLSEFQVGVYESLENISEHIALDTVEVVKNVLREFVKLSRHKVPQPNIYQFLVDIITHNIAQITNSVSGAVTIHHHKELQKKLKALSSSANEAEISHTRKEMDAVLSRELVYWFQLELAELIFTKLTANWHTKRDAGWVDSFINLSTEGIALLIQQISHEIIEHGWQIPDGNSPASLFCWMKEQATLVEKHDLFKLGESLSDNMALFAIPDAPQFCCKNNQSWCILDAGTIRAAEESNVNYRQTIAEIENSGPTGIGYDPIFDPDTEALNNVLLTWRRYFPVETYNAASTEGERQNILGNHERWIDRADMCLDLAVYKSLPEEVRLIPTLVSQLSRGQKLLQDTLVIEQEYQDTLNAKSQLITERTALLEKQEPTEEEQDRMNQIEEDLIRYEENLQYFRYQLEKGSSDDIRMDVELIAAQLAGARSVRDAIDVETLKNVSFFQATVDIVGARDEEDDPSFGIILSQEFVLTEPQLRGLVNQAVDDLIARRYKRKGDSPGQIRRHLDACREKQEECAFKSRGSLRTEVDANGDYYEITPDRLRDYADRGCYIDIATKTDATDFRDVIIGGCLRAVQADPCQLIPDNIQTFLAEQSPEYADAARKKFDLFRTGKLELTAEQRQILEPYVLSERYDLLATRGHFAVKPGSSRAPAASATINYSS